MGERTRGTRKANQLDTLRTSWLAKGTLIQRLREFVWVGGCVTTRRRGPHRQGDDAGVYTDWPKWPLRAVLGHLCTLLRRGLGLWVALGSQQCTQIGQNGLSGPFWSICVHCCDARVVIRIATRAAPGGMSASTTMACRRRLLAGPSRLVGKTDSARVAPLLGWRLRRGVNPHEPLKSPDSWRSRPNSHCHSALNVPKSHVHHRVAV